MRFACQAIDAAGHRIDHSVEANNPQEAVEQIRSQGLFLVGLHPERSEKPAESIGRSYHKAWQGLTHSRHMAMFTQQMTMLLGTGAGVVPSLAAIERQVRGKSWRSIIAAVREEVESGSSLADALGKFPEHFSGVMRSMVAAGESTGTLAELFARLAQMTRRQASIRNHLIGASIYPILLLLVAFGVIGTMLGFVLPRFSVLFTTLRVDLPTSTGYLLAMGTWLRGNWPYLGLTILGSVIGATLWLRTPQGKEAIDVVMIRMPGFGSLVRRIIIARTLRIWGLLLESNIQLLDAMQLSRGTTGNTVFRRFFDDLEAAVTEGKSMVPVLASSPLISPSIVEGVHTGEQSGGLSTALLFLADQLDAENEELLNALTRIVEPMILIVMGFVVGAIAISLFLPLFDIASAASGGR